MATITPTIVTPLSGYKRVTWDALTTGGDVGEPILSPHFSDKTVQVTGAFGGGQIVIEGSNDGVSFFPLTDPLGNQLTFSSSGLKLITENPELIRPRLPSGSGASVVVKLAATTER